MLRALAILVLLTAGPAAALEPTLLAKLGSDRFRYPGAITKLVVSPDGKWVAVSGSAPIWVYDAATGRPVWRGPRENGLGANLSFGHGFRGDRLLALQFDFGAGVVIHHYDLHAPRPVHTVALKVTLGGPEADFSPDGTLLAVPNGRRVTLFDTQTGREVNRVLLPRGAGTAEAARFSPDGRRLAVHTDKGTFCAFDRLTGRELARYKAKQAPRAFALAPDGNRLTVILDDNSLESLDLLTGARKKWKVGEETFDEVVGLPGDRVLTLELSASKLQVFDAATGKKVRTVPTAAGLAGALFESPALAPDGRTLFCGAMAGGGFLAESSVLAIDLTTGRRLPRSADEDVGYAQFRFHGADRLSGARPASQVGVDDRYAWTQWRLPDGRGTTLPDTADAATHDLTADGLRRLTLAPGRAAVLSTATGKALAAFPIPTADATIAWFHDDDRTVAVRTPAAVLLFDLATGRSRRVATDPVKDRETILAAGRWFATHPAVSVIDPTAPPPKPEIAVYDLATGKPGLRLEDTAEDDWRFTPDGRWLVRHTVAQTFSPDGTSLSRLDVQYLDPATGRVGRRARAVAGRTLLDIAPDGRTLLLAGEAYGDWPVDGDVVAVEAATGKVRWRLPPTPDWSVTGGSFAPDGRRVAVGTGDGFVRVWRVGGGGEPMPAEKLWAALGGDDAERAFDAVRTLGRAPDVALPLLRAKLPPAAAVDPTKVAGWLAELDSARFAVRDAATKNLAAALPQARPALEATLAVTPSPEVRDRLTDLLDAAARLSPADVRTIRAVEAVECLATDADLAPARPRAVALLRDWAAGAADAVLTAEAAEALARLKAPASGGR